MATVTNPLHSDFARGKTGGDIVFCDGVNRRYVTNLALKRKVCTEKQKNIRNLNKAAWASWKTLTLQQQDCWRRGVDRRFWTRIERKWHVPQKGPYLYVATYMHYHLYPIYSIQYKKWFMLGDYGSAWDENYECWFAKIDGPWGACLLPPLYNCKNHKQW